MTAVVWVGFLLLIFGLLALDLGVFHRRERVISVREALAWSVFWVVLSLIFNFFVYQLYEHHWFGFGLHAGHGGMTTDGTQAALQFLTGYVVEKSLSVDNIFVIAVIFSYFGVPRLYQHRVLYWGILGALVMRGVMIGAGAALIATFSWMIYVFGVVLLVSAARLLVVREDAIDPDANPAVRLVRRLYPVTPSFEGHSFFVHRDGRTMATPLFVALVVVETTDVVFAVDSIPAIFAITTDPFIVFTSNVFAILGLRALFFALAGIIQKFHYLKTSLVFVLAYIGVKMLLSHHYPIPTAVSLAVIGGLIAVGVIASLVTPAPDRSGDDEGTP